MNILVLHNIEDFQRVRRSTLDYVLAFERYQPDHNYHYQRILDPPPDEVVSAKWDAVILESTALGIVTIRPRSRYFEFRDQWDFLKDDAIVKLVFPQDDANCGGLMDDWFRDWGVQFVFSVRAREHWPVLYPKSVKSAEFRECLSGYIDDRSLPDLRAFSKPWAKRTRLIGQRVTMYPPRGGRQGRLKGLIAEAVKQAATKRKIKADISTDPKDTFFGDEWYGFLGDCKYVLATEGGLSLNDPYGEIADRIEAFVAAHPGASFEEIETACFAGLDGQNVFSGFSPRILEAAVCGASQVLVEGHYLGALVPGTHYLPVKPDGSNIDAVLDALKDEAGAKRRVDACNEVLVENPSFRYSALAAAALGAVSEKVAPKAGAAPFLTSGQARAGSIRRLTERERDIGYRWPELGERVAAQVSRQIVPLGRHAQEPEEAHLRALVEVFQFELDRLAATVEEASPAAKFVATFRDMAETWQALASTDWTPPVRVHLKALSATFAGVRLESPGAGLPLQSTSPVLTAFGAAPEQAAMSEVAANVPPGSDLPRFARAAVKAGLDGLMNRLAPADGDVFTGEEAIARQKLDAILIRAASGGIEEIERFQAYAPRSALLLDVLAEGGDSARALLALAESRAPLAGLLSRLAPAVEASFSQAETDELKILDTIIVHAMRPLPGLEQVRQFEPVETSLAQWNTNDLGDLRDFLSAAHRAEAVLRSVHEGAAGGVQGEGGSGLQLLLGVVGAIVGIREPGHSDSSVDGETGAQLARLLNRVAALRQSDPTAAKALVEPLSGTRAVVAKGPIWPGIGFLVVRTDGKV